MDRTGGRHTGFKAVSTAQGKQQDRPTSRIPSPLMGEESKSLSQCLTLGAEGENDAPASSRHCGLDPQSRGAGWSRTMKLDMLSATP